ncbi:MAG TPA: cytochrome b/b6 domain-containing protein [Candidatus Limnocylindria bacterium]|nr:cytochrome b/b6 domain-containing protein [Candidatus Limnocylindria bacterium]
MRILSLLLVLVGLGIAGAAFATILGQAASGTQPWSPELSDNFVFVKAMPFALGLGIAVGVLGGLAPRRRAATRPDGAVKRFSRTSIFLHWLITIGFVLALPTGIWQYLGGIIDVHAPVPLYLIYRVHYIGATIVLFCLAAFLAYSWMTRDRSLVVPRGQWRAHIRGLMDELPGSISRRLAGPLRVNMREPAPSPGRFTFYERVVSFPSWTFVMTLITVTGIVKAARFLIEVPGFVLFVMSTLHVAAMVLIILKILDHLRYTIARWPMMVAMTTGWLPPTHRGAPERTVTERGGSAAALHGSDT